MKKFFIRTQNFVEHHIIQKELYSIGYKWFVDDKKIDTGNCGYILIVGDTYVTISSENKSLQPYVTDGFVEFVRLDEIPVLR